MTRARVHRPAWAAFNRAIGSNGDVGIWLIYRVRPGDYECVYSTCRCSVSRRRRAPSRRRGGARLRRAAWPTPLPTGDELSIDSLPLALAVGVVALLYSAIGQAGASGYIAVMSLAGLAPGVIRPTALLLNVLVGAIASFQFWRAGHFSWPLFWPFALLAAPMAFVGGALALPARVFQLVVGTLLLLSAARLLARVSREVEERAPPRGLACGLGAGVGLLAGLTGTGGGIFLSPLLVLRGWARAQRAAAVTAAFVLLNSLAGLAGNFATVRELPALALPLAVAVVAGGSIGSWLGSRRLPSRTLECLLALVLALGGAKLVLGL